MNYISYFYIFFCALLVTFFLVPPVMNLAVRIGGVDKPDERKIHSGDTPRLGGIAIFCGFLFTIIFFVDIDRQIKGFLSGAVIIFLTGFADDVMSLRPRHKLLGEVFAALVAVISGGVHLVSLGDPFELGQINLGYFAIPFTIFALVGVMNAINLIDGLDGLAGGVSALACMAFGVIAWKTDNVHLIPVVVALLGALCGFMRYNTYPARIFMGDSGSLLLGYCMGFCSVMLLNNAKTAISIATPVIILAIPILDTLVVMIQRIRRGEHAFSPDKTHLHHRLLDIGFGHKFTVIIVNTVTYLLSVVAIFFYGAKDGYLLTFLICFTVIFYCVLNLLNRDRLQKKDSILNNNSPIIESGTFRTVIKISKYLLICMKYLMILVLALPVFIPPVYPQLITIVAGILAIVLFALFVMSKQWSDQILQCTVYGAGALAIVVIEIYGDTTQLFGASILLYSHVLFALLLVAVLFKMFLRQRIQHLMTTPLDYFVLFVVVSAPLLPSEVTSKYHVLTIAAKSLILFLGYNLVLVRQIKSNRKILLSTSIFLLTLALRYLLG